MPTPIPRGTPRPSRRPPAGGPINCAAASIRTATLANVLANQGVVSGLTGEPLTEATILGIGGGLGAGYILWEFKSHGAPVLTVAFRNQWQYPWIPGWTGKTLERLGIEADVNQTGGAKGAREALDARLDAGSPVIASVDLAMIETWGLPGRFRATSNTFVICGREADGTYLVDDRGRAPFRIAPDVLAAARGGSDRSSTGSFGSKSTEGRSPADRLRAALQAGLEDQVDHLRSKSDSFSLPAWRKWARMMTDERNTKAWPRVFVDGHGLFRALLAIVEAVDASASRGAAISATCTPRRSTRRPLRSTDRPSPKQRGHGERPPTRGKSSRIRQFRRISLAPTTRSRPPRRFAAR